MKEKSLTCLPPAPVTAYPPILLRSHSRDTRKGSWTPLSNALSLCLRDKAPETETKSPRSPAPTPLQSRLTYNSQHAIIRILAK